MKAIVFPGQGSQYVGMGRDFYNTFSEAKEVFHEVDDALEFKLSDIILNGPIESLNLTENTQPAIMTVGVAIYRTLRKQKINELKDYSFCRTFIRRIYIFDLFKFVNFRRWR